jgi:hypothetical protein
MPRVIFISGFNRSGTTLVTSAATQAAQAATLTVGHLATQMPKLAAFMRDCAEKGIVPDRGVDRLPVTESTPEEYGWLLAGATGSFVYDDKAEESGVLHKAAGELAADSGAETVVLKNPWDTGNEQMLLDCFPGSSVIMVRRQLDGMARSQEKAWERMATSHDYVLSLIASDVLAKLIRRTILNPESRKKEVAKTNAATEQRAVGLTESVATLPLDRVAFVSYEELRADPEAGSRWAAHVLDAQAFAGAIEQLSFPEFNDSGQPTETDRGWAAAWEEARSRQVSAGVLA